MLTDALLVKEPGAGFKYQEITVDDDIRDNEVLVKMIATGVCHTDLNFAKEETVPGLFPAVFGHEGTNPRLPILSTVHKSRDLMSQRSLRLTLSLGAGVVVKIGSRVHNTSPGDHVILTYTSCGDCKYCKNHETSYCYDWERDNFGVGRADGSKSYSIEGEAVTSHFFGQSSMAKYAVVMAQSVVKVNKSLPLESLAPLGCGIMTGAGGKAHHFKLLEQC